MCSSALANDSSLLDFYPLNEFDSKDLTIIAQTPIEITYPLKTANISERFGLECIERHGPKCIKAKGIFFFEHQGSAIVGVSKKIFNSNELSKLVSYYKTTLGNLSILEQESFNFTFGMIGSDGSDLTWDNLPLLSVTIVGDILTYPAQKTIAIIDIQLATRKLRLMGDVFEDFIERGAQSAFGILFRDKGNALWDEMIPW